MKKIIFGFLFILVSAIGFNLNASAQDYAVILNNTKVFEEPNARGYVAKNMNDEEVSLAKGMVFKVLDKSNGWDIVEYSPGLRGYIMGNSTASESDLTLPQAGGYNPINAPKEVANISFADGVWTISVNGHNYKGTKSGNVVVFLNEQGQVAYSIVVLGGESLVYTYDNNITKFF